MSTHFTWENTTRSLQVSRRWRSCWNFGKRFNFINCFCYQLLIHGRRFHDTTNHFFYRRVAANYNLPTHTAQLTKQSPIGQTGKNCPIETQLTSSSVPDSWAARQSYEHMSPKPSTSAQTSLQSTDLLGRSFLSWFINSVLLTASGQPWIRRPVESSRRALGDLTYVFTISL